MSSETTTTGPGDQRGEEAQVERGAGEALAQPGAPAMLPRALDGPPAPPLEAYSEDAGERGAMARGKSVFSPVPPHNLDAERSVLGALLLDKDQIGQVVGSLEADDFYLDAHGDIFGAMLSLFSQGTPLDTLTLADELERHRALERVGGLDALASLASAVPTTANLSHYARIVRGHATKRKLIRVGGEVAGLGFDPEVAAGDAVDQAERAIFRVSDGAATSAGPQRVGQAARETVEALRAHVASGGGAVMTGLSLGLESMDRITGGLKPGELTILAARPGLGKSLLAGWCALWNAGIGSPAGVCSLEMGRAVLENRWLAMMIGIDSRRIGAMDVSPSEVEALDAAAIRLSALPLIVDDTASMSIMQVRASARRMVASTGIRLLIVDYLGLMHSDVRPSSRTEEVTWISKALKGLARELEIPVLAVSQLNRESERRSDRKPQLSDLRDSGSIEQDADVVIFIDRPGMREEAKDPGLANLDIAKNRNGPMRMVQALVDLPTGRWSELPGPPAGVMKVFPGARVASNGRAGR